MNGGGGGGRRKIPTSNGRKERDEDLLLFREMHKREKDRVVSLLQPVSDDFESNGNYPLYRMASAKKGLGHEFLGEGEKNDYDWLKTPPATPLFPSLEMEANAPEFVAQREIPIIQPLSRFSGNSEASKASNGRPKSPNRKPKVPPRSVTPSGRPSISLLEMKNTTKSYKPLPNQKINQSTTDLLKKPNVLLATTAKPTKQKESNTNFLTSNLSKNSVTDSKPKPKSRGVSPLVRSTIPAQIPGFSDQTPTNLRTDRSSSVTRDRPGNQALPILRKPESTTNARRQSCSPSVTRGRRVDQKQESEGNGSAQKSRIQAGSGTQVLGSRMVDKFMNARKLSAEDREAKPKLNGSMNESSGFGRMMSKSSLDMALKHMDIKREPIIFRQAGTKSSMGKVLQP